VGWYLIRTKIGMEQWVREQMAKSLPEVFLPLLEAHTERWGKLAWCVNRSFPATFFACFDPRAHRFDVKDMAHVRRVVSTGLYPLTVPEFVIDEIKHRGKSGGVVRIEEKLFSNGERVRVLDGPFRGSWRSWNDVCPALNESQISCIRSNRTAFAWFLRVRQWPNADDLIIPSIPSTGGSATRSYGK
jgi:Transcription termination factor nusG